MDPSDKIHILLVDDRPENIMVLEALLASESLIFHTTTSPNEALKLALNFPIDLALLDVQMPEMDGFELVRILKSNPKTAAIMVVFVTAISKESRYAVKGIEEGAVDYLYKPLDPAVTKAKVEGLLRLVKARRELERQKQELEVLAAMVQQAAGLVMTLDPEKLSVLQVNPAIRKILGYDERSMPGLPFASLLPPEQVTQVLQQLREVREQADSVVLECTCLNTDNDPIQMELHVQLRRSMLILNFHDITARKNQEIQLIHDRELAVQARKVKETFLANMSHEIRTPINGIIGLSQLLRDTKLDTQQSQMLELILNASNSLLGVVNDVLDLSKIEAGHMSLVRAEVNLHQVCNDAVELLRFKAQEKELELMLDYDIAVPARVMADSLRLNQILVNLLGNAIKFTQQGSVVLRVDLLDKEEEQVRVRFKVIDTGIGIKPDKIAQLFGEYAQAEDDTAHQFGGTGLGLSIVKRLVTLKGGSIQVQSEFGRGTEFELVLAFQLPADAAQINSKKVYAHFSQLPALTGVRVLVAEDNPINQMVAHEILKKWELEVTLVSNGKEACEALAKSPFDLVLMDLHMPLLDGYGAAKEIRSTLEEPARSIPIISLSAAVMETEKAAARAAGMNDIVEKPFNPFVLYEKIRQWTQR